MRDRISIPTSEDDAGSPASPVKSWMLLAAGLSILLAIFAVTGDPEPAAVDTLLTGEIGPPPQIETTGPPTLEAFTFPGTGVVSAIDEVEGALVAAVRGDQWGSSIWRLDDTSGTWTLTDALPGVTVLDAIAVPEGLAVAGFDLFDRTPVLSVGPPGELRARRIELGTGEVPHQVDHVAGSLFVFSRFGDGSTPAPAATYRVDSAGGQTSLEPATGEAAVEDVFANDGTVVAVGSHDGEPAMWRVGPDGELEPIEVDIDLDRGLIAAAGRLGSGENVGLVVSGFGSELPSTAVHRLDPPFERLDDPIPGAWDRLVPAGADLLAVAGDLIALPAAGVTTYRTDSGISWVAGRARFTGPGGGGPGAGTIVISDVVFREAGGLVFSGATSEQNSSPIVASEAPVGTSSSIPSARWLLGDEVEPGREVVEVGGIHLSVFDGGVNVRDGFSRAWKQPVFDGENSVGGSVDVIELDFGYLLSATQPYSSVWFSSDGSVWQRIATDVIRMAGSDGAGVVFAGAPESHEVLRVARAGVTEVATSTDPIVATADRLGWVASLGYVAGPANGAVYVSDTGADWAELELDIEVEEIQIGSDALAVRSASEWLRYDAESRSLVRIRTPDGDPLPARQVLPVDGGLLFGDRARSWVSTDFVRWTEASFGIWEGADGPLLDLWVDEDEVIALVGGPSKRSLFSLER